MHGLKSRKSIHKSTQHKHTRTKPLKKVTTTTNIVKKKTTQTTTTIPKISNTPFISKQLHFSTTTIPKTPKDFPVHKIPPNDSERFRGKLILITGAGDGIGRGTAIQLAKEKANLMLIDINEHTLQVTKELCLEAFPNAKIETYKADCSDDAQIEAYVKKTTDVFGRIDGAFINHGIQGPQVSMHEFPKDSFERVIDVNLNGVMFNMKHIIKWMEEKQGFGSIVNTSSIAGLIGIANMAAYNASKHGVVGLTKSGALQYAQTLNINVINPGCIKTRLLDQSLEQLAKSYDVSQEEMVNLFVEANPAKRLGDVSEVAYTVAFLLSHQASLLNGTCINLDSGQIWSF
jgi:NAD(P)-dependent dehydrogenase (short-subunit alcohol dehydrogenase family)